ncbi:hypothetical protein HII36_21940 [Nonomuraea sp. NN258]|uniref:hypothetical protein n=1 Tax=Nonomuraea antri TaxID=2730852 RepID=UPI001568C752|nr:hypothetical protein [Nonomuraea antri]NRQ34489.1 hypothetical protein [Nonomuraea antri]
MLGTLPDAPPGSVIVNVSGLLFGLETGDLDLLLGMLGPNATHGCVQLRILGHDSGGHLDMTASSDPDGLTLAAAFPDCEANSTVPLPHDQSDAVRAAIEEAGRSE